MAENLHITQIFHGKFDLGILCSFTNPHATSLWHNFDHVLQTSRRKLKAASPKSKYWQGVLDLLHVWARSIWYIISTLFQLINTYSSIKQSLSWNETPPPHVLEQVLHCPHCPHNPLSSVLSSAGALATRWNETKKKNVISIKHSHSRNKRKPSSADMYPTAQSTSVMKKT